MAKVICLSPLKFYDSIQKQNHRKAYAYGQKFPLIMPFNTLLPFQFVVLSSITSITNVQLYKASTDTYISTLNLDISIQEQTGLTLVSCKGTNSLYANITEGNYYIKLNDNAGNSYYSEVFCQTAKTDDCLVIEYYNNKSFLSINKVKLDFTNDFRFKLYLRTQLGKPEYRFEEEVNSRLGYDFIQTQVSKKIYKFNVVAPEYLCDAIELIRLCKHKTISASGRVFDLLTFKSNVKWQEQGDVASVDCEFDADEHIVNICGRKQSGDYNEDFNNDFNNNRI